jgi:putative tryptophan/tyrosine transport system substrate-binding protein
MRRRQFILALGGAAAAWPLGARAQQPALPVIGFLDSGSPAGMEANLAGFRRGLSETGYTEVQNLAIEYRWARGRYDQLPALAAELVRRPVAVIAATRTSAPGLAAKAATSTIPIVFQTGSDPVKDGLVASLNRPGGNVTGASRLSTDLIPKRLGLMAELVPKMTAIALLVNPAGPQSVAQVHEMQEPTRALGLQLHVVNASTEHELDTAFAAIVQSGAGALIVAINPLSIARREQIVALAQRHAVPVIFAERESVMAGGLMSYAASFTDSFRQVGVYVGRILKGASPADLPVQQPVRFELVINLKTAKALGLTVPPSLLTTADEVIE